MPRMVYALVARASDVTTLAECALVDGNFTQVGAPRQQRPRRRAAAPGITKNWHSRCRPHLAGLVDWRGSPAA